MSLMNRTQLDDAMSDALDGSTTLHHTEHLSIISDRLDQLAPIEASLINLDPGPGEIQAQNLFTGDGASAIRLFDTSRRVDNEIFTCNAGAGTITVNEQCTIEVSYQCVASFANGSEVRSSVYVDGAKPEMLPELFFVGIEDFGVLAKDTINIYQPWFELDMAAGEVLDLRIWADSSQSSSWRPYYQQLRARYFPLSKDTNSLGGGGAP